MPLTRGLEFQPGEELASAEGRAEAVDERGGGREPVLAGGDGDGLHVRVDHRRAELLHLRQQQRKHLLHAQLHQVPQRGLAEGRERGEEPAPELPEEGIRVRVTSFRGVHQPVVDERPQRPKRGGRFVPAPDAAVALILTATHGALLVPQQRTLLQVVEEVRVGDGAHGEVVRLELDAHAPVRPRVVHLRPRGHQGIVQPGERAVAATAPEVRHPAGPGPQELSGVPQRPREERIRGVKAPVAAEVTHGDVSVPRDGDAFGEPVAGSRDARARRLGGVDLPPDGGHGRGVRGVGGDAHHGKPGERRDHGAQPSSDALTPDRSVGSGVDARVRGSLHEAQRGSLGILEVRLEVPGHRQSRGFVVLDVLHGPFDRGFTLVSRRVVGDGFELSPRGAPPSVHRRRRHLAHALLPPAVTHGAGLDHHQNGGPRGWGVKRVDALVLTAGAVQRHVAHHAADRRGGIRIGEGYVPALRGGSHLEVVEVVLEHRVGVLGVGVAAQGGDAADSLHRRLDQRDVPLEHAEDVGVGE